MTVSRVWMPPSVSAVLVADSLRLSPSRLSSASSRSASMFCSSLWPASACAKRPAISFCAAVSASSRGARSVCRAARGRARQATTKIADQRQPSARKASKINDEFHCLRTLPGGRLLDRTPALAYLRLMAIRPILTAPDPRLKAVSRDVERVDAEIRMLIDDMFDSMYAADGIGLAAIQIGVPKRVIVMDLAQKDGETEPARLHQSENPLGVGRTRSSVEEGCLSVPDIWEDVERPARIKAEYLDRDGKPMTLEAEGLLATCLQHEMDHLEGVLFLDHLSRLKRSMALRKLAKAKRLAAVE